MIWPTHRMGRHPQTKKHFDFSSDRYAYYWIYLKYKGRRAGIFNTYDWYIAKRTKNYVIWKNFYYDEKDSPIIRIKFSYIRKVICWKVSKYDELQWNLIEQED